MFVFQMCLDNDKPAYEASDVWCFIWLIQLLEMLRMIRLLLADTSLYVYHQTIFVCIFN